jgi:alpha-glucosidase
MTRASKTPWWQSAVIYQIYPRSFQDSNADGVGDLTGIERRLDYLKSLGVDALWISPCFPSPMVDFGYDVSNYCDIDPLFGTLADFDRLLNAAHARGLKVLLDFVPNHSSDQHKWFIESRSSKTNPKRDWYIWRDPASDGGPPNNWISDFGGPAWEFDPATNQYYSHAFLKEQPDLNWRNPEVRKAMLSAMEFWFKRGVDGFRIDVLWHMVKCEDFRDNPLNPDFHPSMGEMHKVLQLNSTDQPEVHEIAREMRALADKYGDRLLIGEIYLPLEKLMTYYGDTLDEVQLPFNFQLIDAKWTAEALAELISSYERALPSGAWPNWVLSNHDRPRIAARLGDDRARLATLMLLTLRGTPTLYYGDEVGIGHVEIPSEKVQDPRELREPGLGLGRDPERTPMPWDASLNAGFSQSEPWLPLNHDWQKRNVETLSKDGNSILEFHRNLLELRRKSSALTLGTISDISADSGVLSYRRKSETEDFIVVLNFSDQASQLPTLARSASLETILSTHTQTETSMLQPYEGRIYRVD